MVQTVFLLRLMANLSGLKPGKVYHKLVNCHIYDDQLELMKTQLTREPFKEPRFFIADQTLTLEDIEENIDPRNKDLFWIEDYQHHDPIRYPMSG